jgi:hypothetical protein
MAEKTPEELAQDIRRAREALQKQVDEIRNALQPVMGLVDLVKGKTPYQLLGEDGRGLTWREVQDQVRAAASGMARVKKALDEIWALTT